MTGTIPEDTFKRLPCWSESLCLLRGRIGKNVSPMTIDIAPFRVPEGETVNLKQRPTKIAPLHRSKEDHDTMLAAQARGMDRLQQRLYAANSYALLLIFQAMDVPPARTA